MFHLDSCGQWLISPIHLFPTICRDKTMSFFTAAFEIHKTSLTDSQRPASAAQMFNLHYSDLSEPLPCIQCNLVAVTPQCQINHSAICVNRNANLSLPLSAANLNIWCVEVFFFFYLSKGIVYTGLTESVQAGFGRISQSDMCTAINGFSVTVSKQNWSLRSMMWLTDKFALESHTEREGVEEANT